ncbi:complex I subunit 1/NuoH family protein [Nitriliruptor alkaliphilus]|uniref:complex I subunit 1/NuoH family protein n=1 Tax=Nitriliruptor alkaliphilus TaxID=427918 RepID=UPI000695D48B|nr:NADH-quinone oxidoreductase subunit H [Nitriliruptor alkaliphilus]
MTETFPFWVYLVRAVAVFLYFLLFTALLIWAERRILGRMQSRLGPNRVGPFGIMQTLVDGLKMFFKEDVTPGMVNKPIFVLAPLIGVIAGFLSVAVIPLGGNVTMFGETFPLVVADLHVGILWFLAMGSIHVYSTFLAGWASNSPYPLLGGVRSSAQMVSYEIAQGLAVASVFIYTGSLRVSDIIAAQDQALFGIEGIPGWNVVPLFPAFLVFVVGMVAEAGRPPFDLAEAEGELVGGFNTEYSGMKFGMFMLAEFMAAVTMSAVVVTLFFGGPNGPTFGLGEPFTSLLPILWFTLKVSVFVLFFILLRGALPRVRYKQLMDLGWKVLIPVALVWTMVTAGFVLIEEVEGGLPDGARITLAVLAGLVLLFALFGGRGDDTEPGTARGGRRAPAETAAAGTVDPDTTDVGFDADPEEVSR